VNDFDACAVCGRGPEKRPSVVNLHRKDGAALRVCATCIAQMPQLSADRMLAFARGAK
jgi:ribosome-binding protein aMBF1 (putative translation factor)